MSWKMKCMDKKYLTKSLDLVERVFTESENAESGNTVRRLVEEIRSKRFYLPELELIMTDEMDEVIGYAMFSGFHLEGRYEGQLLLLSPVGVGLDHFRSTVYLSISSWLISTPRPGF